MRTSISLFLLPAIALSLGGCSADKTQKASEDPAPLVIYSGRSETLMGPLLQRFEAASGVRTQVRWGETGELAAAILEEGAASPAKVFLAQDAASLATLAGANVLLPLPDDLLSQVEPRWADPKGRWVGLSGRIRTLVLDPERIAEADRPSSLKALTDPRWKGKLALAPGNASLQAHLAAYRAINGGDSLRSLLAGIAANEPAILGKNTAIVEAVLTGESEIGLTNHYYLLQAQKQRGKNVGLNWLPTTRDGSVFVNLAGVGLLDTNDRTLSLVRFLLSEEAQLHFAEQTFELPLARGFKAKDLGMNAQELPDYGLDFSRIAAELPATVQDLRESGLLP